jgi:hypothetical protein
MVVSLSSSWTQCSRGEAGHVNRVVRIVRTADVKHCTYMVAVVV